MSKPFAADLDAILKQLIDDPKQFDSVKRTLQGRIQAPPQRSTSPVMRRMDDDDDLWDNVPV